MNIDSIIALEKKLLDSSVRKDPVELNLMLADDFVEFGTSGKIYDKKIIIERLSEETSIVMEAFNFKGVVLSQDVVQLTFKTKRKNEDGTFSASLRCSIWKLKGSHWQMLFHQGTKTELI